MVTLGDLMFLVNDSANVQILDNELGEVLIEDTASDVDAEEYVDCPIMDIYAWENRLVICIEVM